MSNNIEAITTIAVTAAQAQAIRKLSLRSKKSANELATDLFSQVVRGRFKAVAETISADAAAMYDKAVAGGFEPPMERAEYIASAAASYKDILIEL